MYVIVQKKYDYIKKPLRLRKLQTKWIYFCKSVIFLKTHIFNIKKVPSVNRNILLYT